MAPASCYIHALHGESSEMGAPRETNVRLIENKVEVEILLRYFTLQIKLVSIVYVHFNVHVKVIY